MPRLRRAPHQGLLPALRRDGVQRLRAARRRGRAAGHRHRATGRSRSCTPASTRRSASGCAGCAQHVEGEEMFLANYADVLTDAPLDDMIDRFRAQPDTVGALLAVPPQSAFHCVDVGDDDPIHSISTAAARCRSGRTAATSCSGRRSSTTSRRTATWSATAAMVLAKEGRHDGLPATAGSGSPPTRSRSAPRWRPPTRAAPGRGCCGTRERARRARSRCRPRSRPCATTSTSADAQPAARAPRPAGAARRALRRHRDRRGRHAAGAVPRAPRASRSRRSCSPAAGRCARRRNGPRWPRSARARGSRSPCSTCPTAGCPPAGSGPRARWRSCARAGEPDLILAPDRARRPPGPPHARQARAHRRSATTSRWATRSSSGRATSPSPPSSSRSPSRCCGRRSPSCTSTTAASATAPGSTPRCSSGLARVRGVQCHARYAEAFHAVKMVLGVGPAAGPSIPTD